MTDWETPIIGTGLATSTRTRRLPRQEPDCTVCVAGRIQAHEGGRSLQPEHLFRRAGGEHRQRPARKLLLATRVHPVQHRSGRGTKLGGQQADQGLACALPALSRPSIRPSSRPIRRPRRSPLRSSSSRTLIMCASSCAWVSLYRRSSSPTRQTAASGGQCTSSRRSVSIRSPRRKVAESCCTETSCPP